MKSIRIQILIYLMVGSIILFGILFLFTNNKLNELPRHIEKQYIEISKARADEVSKELEGLIDPIKLLSKSSLIKSMDMEKIKNFLPELNLDDKYKNMTVSDLEGNAWNTNFLDLNITEQEQYSEVILMGKENHISQPFESMFIDEKESPLITVAHRIKDDYGKTLGLINGIVEVEFLDKIVESIELSKEGYVWIVNSQWVLITHSEMEESFGVNIKDLDSKNNKGINAIFKEKSSKVEYINNEGLDIIAFSSPIKNSPGWTFVISMDRADVFKDLDQVKDTILKLIASSVAFLLLFAFYYSDKLTKPILNLKDTFELASNGNLNIRADETSNNELGQAARSFNKMLGQIKELTYNDVTTGIYNYNGFLITAKNILMKERYNGKIGSIIIISLDNFKNINTIYGFDLGDKLLKRLSNLLGVFIKEDEVLARFLGDEFVIFLQGEDEETIRKRVYNMWKVCNNEMNLYGKKINQKTSIGVATRTMEDFSIEDLIHEATIAKYKVKESGGNGVEFYDCELEEDIIRDQDIENYLYDSIKNDELRLVYQPIIDAYTGKIVSIEALLRWDNPHTENISTMKTIEIAERNGFIIEIGEWVLREACRKNKYLQDQGYEPIKVAVNVSALQFQQINFPYLVKSILEETGMEGRYLELEVTETNIMDRVESKIEIMELLKALDISISLDDFGTGYSSLSYLTRFPIDVIKIDKSFVHKMLVDESSKTIVSTIISMAMSLKLKIIAEGVETIEQFDHLKEQGCHKIQGYLISRPTDIQTIKEILRERN